MELSCIPEAYPRVLLLVSLFAHRPSLIVRSMIGFRVGSVPQKIIRKSSAVFQVNIL